MIVKIAEDLNPSPSQKIAEILLKKKVILCTFANPFTWNGGVETKYCDPTYQYTSRKYSNRTFTFWVGNLEKKFSVIQIIGAIATVASSSKEKKHLYSEISFPPLKAKTPIAFRGMLM
jgi:hypothetical protein